MRIVTVDNGNSNPHVGIFQDEKLISVLPLKDYSYSSDDFILISSVGAPIDLKPSFNIKTLRRDNLFLDMPIHYSETLGDDRLVIAHLIYKNLKPGEKVLVIDAGTFMTMDLIDQTGFAGGFIFPGIKTFLSSYQKGSHLPLIDLKEDFELKSLPHSTEEAILGATELYLNSVLEGIIKKILPTKIVITGGSLELLKSKISKINLPKVQFEMNPHLLHASLFSIYQNHLRLK